MTQEIIQKQTEQKFKDFIIKQGHPCVVAQTVTRTNQLLFKNYHKFGSKETATKMLHDIKSYIENYNFQDRKFYSFVASFPQEEAMSELEFENLLWKQLQFIHEVDNIPWDKEVSKNPESEYFSFSIVGKAFYIVGMHPNSSRKARRSPFPSIAFNLHLQFERLRKMHQYENVKKKIRENDRNFQGNNNPMLEDFGNASEARQYSGREVTSDWKCPFHHKSEDD